MACATLHHLGFPIIRNITPTTHWTEITYSTQDNMIMSTLCGRLHTIALHSANHNHNRDHLKWKLATGYSSPGERSQRLWFLCRLMYLSHKAVQERQTGKTHNVAYYRVTILQTLKFPDISLTMCGTHSMPVVLVLMSKINDQYIKFTTIS